MKQIYLITIFLLSFTISNAQNPEIFGTWFLQSITENGMSPITTEPDSYTLIIEDDTLNPNNDFIARGDMRCNSYQSECSFPTSTIITLTNNSVTLAQCGGEESLYIDILYNNSNQIDHSYQITGTGNNASLTLTNSNNDVLLYGRQVLATNRVEKQPQFKLVKTITSNVLEVITSSSLNITYSIISLSGKIITENKNLANNEIIVNHLNSGLYFLSLTNTKNNKTEILKFIKE